MKWNLFNKRKEKSLQVRDEIEKFAVIYFKMHSGFGFTQKEQDWYNKFSEKYPDEFNELCQILYDNLLVMLIDKLIEFEK